MLKKYPIDVYLLTVLQVVLYVDTSLISLRILNNLKHRRLIFPKTRKKNKIKIFGPIFCTGSHVHPLRSLDFFTTLKFMDTLSHICSLL